MIGLIKAIFGWAWYVFVEIVNKFLRYLGGSSIKGTIILGFIVFIVVGYAVICVEWLLGAIFSSIVGFINSL